MEKMYHAHLYLRMMATEDYGEVAITKIQLGMNERADKHGNLVFGSPTKGFDELLPEALDAMERQTGERFVTMTKLTHEDGMFGNFLLITT